MKWSMTSAAVLGLALTITTNAGTEGVRLKEVYIVHFSHTDVGFTDHPAVCRELFRRYLDVAIDTVLESQQYSAGERFCWTAESTLAVKDWYDTVSPERRQQFLAAVRSGRLDVSALACNNTPFLNARQWQTMVHWLPEELWREVRPQVAVQNDVNGFPRAGARALLDRGIHRLFMGINEDSGGSPFRRPSAFWWKMPDGRRLFVWLNEGYGSGFSYFEPGEWRRGPVPRAADACFRPPRAGEYLRGDEASVRLAHKRCVESLRRLEKNGYRHEVLVISLTNQWRFDNDPPFPPIADFVATWNRLNLKPVLRLTTVTEALRRLETTLGPQAPEYEGEWTDWWANGTASAPREVSASRAAKRFLDSALAPLWGPLTDTTRATADELLRDLCLFDEHTWGSSLSVAQPDSLDTLGQFNEKARLAYRPLARAEWLLAQRARTFLANRQEGLFLANPTPAPYTGWVTLTASALRESFRSVEDPHTGKRHRLSFEPGIQPWGRPRQPQDLSREDVSATFPDRAPNQVARFWMANLEGNSIKRLRLSLVDGEDAVTGGRTAPGIEVDQSGWPKGITWPGMAKSLFLPGIGDLSAVGVKGLAPRWTLADLRGSGSRREQLRHEKIEETWATPEGKTEVVQTAHTICYSQAVRHPRLRWGTRVLEVWKRQPRAKLVLRINRLSSAAPEILYVSFPFPTGTTLPRLSNGGEPFIPFTDQLPGTCRDYLAIDGWAAYDTPQGSWLWVSRDVPLISLGASPTLAFYRSPPSDVHRLRAMVFNNFWYTNFVADSHGIMQFQFDVAWMPQAPAGLAGLSAALSSEPVVVINPAAREEPRLMKYLYRP
jgi:hypothetical protein